MSVSVSCVCLCVCLCAAALTVVCRVVAAVTNKTLDPAASRELNKDCSVFSFYDNHDTWHLLSAYGIFFVLMHIETADERLWGFKRKLILRAGGRW